MSRDEQIKKLAEDMDASIPWELGPGIPTTTEALLPYATSLVEKDEEIAQLSERAIMERHRAEIAEHQARNHAAEIARLKEKLGIAEEALEDSFDTLKRAPDLNALGYNEANAAAIKFMGTPKDVAGLDDSSYRVIAKEIHTQIMFALGRVKAALAAIREKGTE